MKKKGLLMVVVGIVLATANAPTAGAQKVTSAETSQTSVLPVTGVSESTDGSYNFRSFEVKAPKAGNYYTEFWLLPAKYANNRYTTFKVYVTENYVGSITPTVGNWQSARVNENETLELKEGINVITVATQAPEFPEVETVKVALKDSDASFSPDAYEEYLDKVSSGVTFDMPEEEGMSMYATEASNVGIAFFSNVPLNYTFYKIFSFTKDQEIFITSSSSASHKIDAVYYGSTFSPSIDVINSSDSAIIHPGLMESGDSINSNTGRLLSYIKPRHVYKPATSEEMQGLNWVFPSEKALNSSTQIATAKLTIPKTGLYLIRVRHAVKGCSSVADVNVNGAYFYENGFLT